MVMGILSGVAISAIVMMGLHSITTGAFSNTQKIMAETGFSQKMSELNLLLRNKNLCQQALRDIPLSVGQEVAIKNYNGQGVFLEKGKNSIKGVQIHSLRIKNVTVEPRDPSEASITLDLSYQDPKNNKQSKEFLLFVSRDPQTNRIKGCSNQDAYLPGEIYSRCYLQQNAAQENLWSETTRWPFTACPGAGTGKQKPQCATGFQPVILSFNQGNTDHSHMNMANKIFWITYGCAKQSKQNI